MGKGIYIWILFAIMVMAQLAIPTWMIKGQEDVLRYGTEYKFNTEPVDPYDLMRGKYVTLSFSEDRARAAADIKRDDVVYISIAVDEDGFAMLKDAQLTPPSNGLDYLELPLDYYFYPQDDSIRINLPFDRFYMEESKAQAAEDLYRQSVQEVQNESYALVMVKDGKAALKDVLIDGVPIKEAVEAMQAEAEE